MDWDRKWLVDFHVGKTQFVSIGCSSSCGAIDVKMDWCVRAVFGSGLSLHGSGLSLLFCLPNVFI